MVELVIKIKEVKTITRMSALFDYARACGLDVEHLTVDDALDLMRSVELEMARALAEINETK